MIDDVRANTMKSLIVIKFNLYITASSQSEKYVNDCNAYCTWIDTEKTKVIYRFTVFVSAGKVDS